MTKDARRTKHEIILDIWEKTGSSSLGASELAEIQKQLAETFGSKGVESPAGIARILAEEGIPLRHPEILEVDSEWRKARLNTFFEADELNFNSVENALESVRKVDELTSRFISSGDDSSLQDLMGVVRELKADLSCANNELSVEVVQWLTILLQNPAIFTDWLTLRQNAPDFRRKFRSLA